MLAYVFWHWSAPGTSQPQYEEYLRKFHGALAAHPPDGFTRSAAFRIAGARWLQQPSAYEDWYLVNDFASLGILNDAAVSGQRKLPHDDAARLAAGGTAGVYKLVLGEVDFCCVSLCSLDDEASQHFIRPVLPGSAGLDPRPRRAVATTDDTWAGIRVLPAERRTDRNSETNFRRSRFR